MTAYIISYLLCSLMMYIPYKLWIEGTSLHHFKRLYLLCVILLPIVIPTIEYNIPQSVEYTAPSILPNIEYLEQKEVYIEKSNIQPEIKTSVGAATVFHLENIILALYLLVACVLLFRFFRNLLAIRKEITKGNKITSDQYHIILTDTKHSPYTFWNYIFINKTDYLKEIHPSILKHEEAHVIQKHSMDIIVSEILTVITWFNPINYLVRKNIIDNHEYLADNRVIKDKEYIQEYCYLLLNLTVEKPTPNLTSQLNYKQVKNRLIMMTKKTSTGRRLLVATLSLCILATATILFTQKNILMATSVDEKSVETPNLHLQDSIKNGAPKKLLAEYDSVISAITTIKKNPNGTTFTSRDLSKVDVNRMAFIASLMSAKEIEERTNLHKANSPKTWEVLTTKPKKRTPTKTEFDNWQNSKVYGVWIDGKKSKNSDLKKLSHKDVALYYVSKLYGKAKVGRSYTHQLDVYTEAGYGKSWGHWGGK